MLFIAVQRNRQNPHNHLMLYEQQWEGTSPLLDVKKETRESVSYFFGLYCYISDFIIQQLVTLSCC